MSKHWSAGLCFDNLDNIKQVLLVCEPVNDPNDTTEEWRWSLPGGKCCDNKSLTLGCCQETPEYTLRRKFKEETGHKVALIKLLFSEEKPTSRSNTTFLRSVYLVKIMGGQPLGKRVFNHESPKWFFLSKLPRNLFPSHRKIIEDFVLSLLKK